MSASRRTIILTAAALAAAPALPVRPAPAADDAALLDAYRRWRQVDLERNASGAALDAAADQVLDEGCARYPNRHERAAHGLFRQWLELREAQLGVDRLRAEHAAIRERWYALLDTIIAHPATTASGMAAKAKLLHPAAGEDERDYFDDRLADSLVADLERLAGGAS